MKQNKSSKVSSKDSIFPQPEAEKEFNEWLDFIEASHKISNKDIYFISDDERKEQDDC